MFRFLAAAAFVLAALPGSTALSAGLDTANPAFAQVSDITTSIPIGALEFCTARPAECARNTDVVGAALLTDAAWGELLQVNGDVNASVLPVTDHDLYGVEEFWTFPNGFGDCEDIALAKRRALIERGWPASTLLMAVARQANGEGHAVLMVRTDRGDLILDNQDGSVRVWTDTPYHYLKRQSQEDPGAWVDIADPRAILVASR